MALNYYINQKGEIPNTALSLTDGGALERASRFHKTIPGYAPTPLVSLDHLAQKLGVAQVLVKDESRRFGLNAFKALGGSYAMARCLGQRLGWPDRLYLKLKRHWPSSTLRNSTATLWSWKLDWAAC